VSALPLNLASVIQGLPVDDSVKAQAYNDFTAAQSPQDFQRRFDVLPLPRPVKAQLRDMRFGATPDDPQRFTEAPGVPPSVEAAPPAPARMPMATAPSVDTAPPPQTTLDLPIKPLRKPPQQAQTIGPLPPVTAPSETTPINPRPQLGQQVAVPMSATPAMNAGPTSDPLYQRVSDIARTNGSFGTAKIQRETGARHADISAALERLVNEGAIKRTQNARRSVVYHAVPQQSESY